MQQVSSNELLAALQSVQAGLGQFKPLARVRQQLIGDLAAVLTGLRTVLILDYAPGTNPDQLLQALAPLQHSLPGWQGCILVLDSCCYLANRPLLQQLLSRFLIDASKWPVLVGFRGWCHGAEPHLLQEPPEPLRQQVQLLNAVISSLLPGMKQIASLADEDQLPSAGNNNTAGAAAAAAVAQDTALEPCLWLPTVHLDNRPGLPTLPTMNGLLLSYPVVYYIRDQREADVASRMLSGAQLKLHRVVSTCSAELADLLKAVAGQSSSKATGLQPTNTTLLRSFTVPMAVAGDVVDHKVQQMMQDLRSRQAETDGMYKAVELVVACVGPQAISL